MPITREKDHIVWTYQMPDGQYFQLTVHPTDDQNPGDAVAFAMHGAERTLDNWATQAKLAAP